jgi:hypothetical protein
MNLLWRPISIDRITEPTGTLSVLEQDVHLPFAVKRVFWVSGVPTPLTERGSHAHRELRQVLFAASGRCQLDLEDTAGRKAAILLEAGGDGLYLEGPVWRTMHGFSSDCSLIVLCDREYSLDHVVRDRSEFLAL